MKKANLLAEDFVWQVRTFECYSGFSLCLFARTKRWPWRRSLRAAITPYCRVALWSGASGQRLRRRKRRRATDHKRMEECACSLHSRRAVLQVLCRSYVDIPATTKLRLLRFPLRFLVRALHRRSMTTGNARGGHSAVGGGVPVMEPWRPRRLSEFAKDSTPRRTPDATESQEPTRRRILRSGRSIRTTRPRRAKVPVEACPCSSCFRWTVSL